MIIVQSFLIFTTIVIIRSLEYHPRHLNFTCPAGGRRNCHCPKDLPDDHPGFDSADIDVDNDYSGDHDVYNDDHDVDHDFDNDYSGDHDVDNYD